MAINLSTNPVFAGRFTPVSAAYPYGSAQDETTSGANDGTPYIEIRANDTFGLMQGLLSSAAIVPSGTADTALLSQYVQAIVEIAAGRAVTAVEGASTTNAYIVDVSPNQQAPQSLFDGLRVEAILAAANTGTATLNAYGLGAKTITGSSAGIIVAGAKQGFIFNKVSDQWGFDTQVIPDASETVKGIVEAATTAEMTAGTANKFPDAAKVKAFVESNSPIKATGRVNGSAGTFAKQTGFTSIVRNSAGSWTLTLGSAQDDTNYLVMLTYISAVAGDRQFLKEFPTGKTTTVFHVENDEINSVSTDIDFNVVIVG